MNVWKSGWPSDFGSCLSLHHSQCVNCKSTWYGHQKIPIPLIKLLFKINQKYSCHMLNSSISRSQHHDMTEVLHWGLAILQWPVNFTVPWRFMLGAYEQICVLYVRRKKCNNYAESMRHHYKLWSPHHPRLVHPYLNCQSEWGGDWESLMAQFTLQVRVWSRSHFVWELHYFKRIMVPVLPSNVLAFSFGPVKGQCLE